MRNGCKGFTASAFGARRRTRFCASRKTATYQNQAFIVCEEVRRRLAVVAKLKWQLVAVEMESQSAEGGVSRIVDLQHRSDSDQIPFHGYNFPSGTNHILYCSAKPWQSYCTWLNQKTKKANWINAHLAINQSAPGHKGCCIQSLMIVIHFYHQTPRLFQGCSNLT